MSFVFHFQIYFMGLFGISVKQNQSCVRHGGTKKFLSLNLVMHCPLQFEERPSLTRLPFMYILEEWNQSSCLDGQ